MEEFAEEWLMSLDHDDKKSLSMFLCFNLGRQFSMKDTDNAELVPISDHAHILTSIFASCELCRSILFS